MSCEGEEWRRLLRAAFASCALHAMLLAVPALETPGSMPPGRLRVRLLPRPTVHHAPRPDLSARALRAERFSVEPVPAKTAPPTALTQMRSAEPEGWSSRPESDLAQRSAQTQTLSPEQGRALRGLKITLALALGATPLNLASGCRAVAHLDYQAGGRLAALSLADSNCSRDTERWLIAGLERAAAQASIPATLQASELEIALPLELEADTTGREEP